MPFHVVAGWPLKDWATRAGYTTVFYALGELAQVMNPGEHHQELWISYKKERIVVRSDSSGFVCFRVDLAKERLEQLL